jgi:hypothetical protein
MTARPVKELEYPMGDVWARPNSSPRNPKNDQASQQKPSIGSFRMSGLPELPEPAISEEPSQIRDSKTINDESWMSRDTVDANFLEKGFNQSAMMFESIDFDKNPMIFPPNPTKIGDPNLKTEARDMGLRTVRETDEILHRETLRARSSILLQAEKIERKISFGKKN